MVPFWTEEVLQERERSFGQNGCRSAEQRLGVEWNERIDYCGW